MHEFYKNNKKKYLKEIEKLLTLGKVEIEELFKEDFSIVVSKVQTTFETNFLSDMPYVGGNDNANDTHNLVDCCKAATLFVVGREYNLSDNQIGELLTNLMKKSFGTLPKFGQKIIRKIMKLSLTQKFLIKMTEKSKKFSKEYPYAWEFIYEKPDNEYSHKYICTRCGACMFLTEKGLGDIMPYICNIDYIAFASFGVPYYRNEVIGYGDKRCANLIKIDADVVTDNWPPHGLKKDGLK